MKSANEEVEDAVCEFVRSFLGIKKIVLPGDSIFDDLHVDGMDAADLIAAFSKEFQVDMTGFQMCEYFGPEKAIGLATFLLSIRRIIKSTSSQAAGLSRLHVSDLVNAALKKKWI